MFPGRRPQRAGANEYPYCPPLGYASADPRNWNPRRPMAELQAAFVDDFLKQNGFYAADQAIADTIDAVAATATSTVKEPDALAAPESAGEEPSPAR